MRFPIAWAGVLAQNITYKTVSLILLVFSITLTIALIQVSTRDPLIIERECFSKAMQPGLSTRTVSEIQAFLNESLGMRFNSNSQLNQNYFSQDEIVAQASEQKELSQRTMVQTVIVNSIKIDGGKATVDCDRIVSIGNVRSVLPFTLTVNFSTTARTSFNPYGLIVTHVAISKKSEELHK